MKFAEALHCEETNLLSTEKKLLYDLSTLRVMRMPDVRHLLDSVTRIPASSRDFRSPTIFLFFW